MYSTSRMCRESDLWKLRKYIRQLPSLQEVYPDFNIPKGIKHRKNWEWGFIMYVLEKAGMLEPGKNGLGFAVGTEPLPSYFASRGAKILATDLWETESAEQWYLDQNLRGNKDALNRYEICPPALFKENVDIRNVDMNSLPPDLTGFDFCWSSCAVEHVGSLELGKTFFVNQLATLKPGGISVHTVEFNVSSNTNTIEQGDTAIFRRCDMEEIVHRVEEAGGRMICAFQRGRRAGDKFVDVPPYYHTNPKYHLHLNI